ncbi:MAG: molecular chaperone DnaJ, partial [Microcoleus sp. SIO2G3]|nr:molecular chaperone DnaJ [Microcoleus sp. SIO2G3]
LRFRQVGHGLSETQYEPLQQFELITPQIEELNVIYLRLKMGEPMIREKRTGIIAAKEAKPIEFVPLDPTLEKPRVSYAQRHYIRAQEYMKQAEWKKAENELRDAIRLEPKQSDFHALLAKTYLMQNLPGMAKVHFQQALKLNPRHEMALQYAHQLKIPLDPLLNGTTTKDAKGGLFGGLFVKKQ